MDPLLFLKVTCLPYVCWGETHLLSVGFFPVASFLVGLQASSPNSLPSLLGLGVPAALVPSLFQLLAHCLSPVVPSSSPPASFLGATTWRCPGALHLSPCAAHSVPISTSWPVLQVSHHPLDGVLLYGKGAFPNTVFLRLFLPRVLSSSPLCPFSVKTFPISQGWHKCCRSVESPGLA
jgi:hypothetical protein